LFEELLMKALEFSGSGIIFRVLAKRCA